MSPVDQAPNVSLELEMPLLAVVAVDQEPANIHTMFPSLPPVQKVTNTNCYSVST